MTTKIRRCAWCDQPFTPYRNRTVQKYCCQEHALAATLPRGDGLEDELRGRIEQFAKVAPRAQPKPLDIRQITAQGRTYAALDANAWLEDLLESENARPGHLYG